MQLESCCKHRVTTTSQTLKTKKGQTDDMYAKPEPATQTLALRLKSPSDLSIISNGNAAVNKALSVAAKLDVALILECALNSR